jgi:hypothetical protein
MGVGMIHRTAESQISTPATDGSAASAASESSAATPNAAALHTSGKPHEVLLEWSKP